MTRYQFTGPKSSLLAFYVKFQHTHSMSLFSVPRGQRGSCLFLDVPETVQTVVPSRKLLRRLMRRGHVEAEPIPSHIRRVGSALGLTPLVVIP